MECFVGSKSEGRVEKKAAADMPLILMLEDAEPLLCLSAAVPRRCCASPLLRLAAAVPRRCCASSLLRLAAAVPRRCCVSPQHPPSSLLFAFIKVLTGVHINVRLS